MMRPIQIVKEHWWGGGWQISVRNTSIPFSIRVDKEAIENVLKLWLLCKYYAIHMLDDVTDVHA